MCEYKSQRKSEFLITRSFSLEITCDWYNLILLGIPLQSLFLIFIFKYI